MDPVEVPAPPTVEESPMHTEDVEAFEITAVSPMAIASVIDPTSEFIPKAKLVPVVSELVPTLFSLNKTASGVVFTAKILLAELV